MEEVTENTVFCFLRGQRFSAVKEHFAARARAASRFVFPSLSSS